MKIEAIRGCNIASLEGDFCLDFNAEPLASAGIFAISGPTGSGKSTLLDTMCLALFGRTPRTEQAKENNVKVKDIRDDMLAQSDPRFLLRRGTASGYAEVDFLALNGQHYRARWSVRRAREKEDGTLQGVTISLINLDSGTPEQGKNKELQQRIVQLIGLTFEQFTRSVLLAQNDFSTFLKAEQSDKAALLEKLTGTDIYSQISRLIYTKCSEAKADFDAVQAKIQGIELLSKEELEEWKTKQKALAQELSALEKEKKERQLRQEAVKNRQAQSEQIKKQQVEVRETLENARKAQLHVQEELEKAISAQQQEEAFYQNLQPELLRARKTDIQLETLNRSVKEKKQTWEKAVLNYRTEEKKYKDAIQRWEKGMQSIQALTQWFEKHHTKEHIAEQLPALLLHLDSAEEQKKQAETLNSKQKSLAKRQSQWQKDWQKMANTLQEKQKKCQESACQIARMEKQLQQEDIRQISADIELLQKEREQKLVEKAQFGTTGDIPVLRGRLIEGQPCPVCGSTHHPFALPETDIWLQRISEEIDRATLRLNELNRKKTQHLNEEKQLNLLSQQHITLQQELLKEESQHKELGNQLMLIQEQLADTRNYLSEAEQKLERALQETTSLFGHTEWIKSWKENAEGFRTQLTEFSHQWKERKAQLNQLQQEQGGWKSTADTLQAFLPSLSEQVKRAEQDYKVQVEENNQLKAERNRLLNGANPDDVEQACKTKIETWKQKQQQLTENKNRQAAIVAQEEGRLKQLDENLLQALQLQQEAEKQWLEWISDYETRSEGISLDTAWEETNRLNNEVQFRLRTHQENKQRIAQWQESLKQKQLYYEQWAQLNDLAGSSDGSKFRRIAQGYTLDVLLSYANVHLRELTKRYRLERVPDTLALQVIDKDMCDEVRTIHSLSGGESFLVSLALALGLSSLSSNRMKVESLFIDEGFGSLDAETLRIALDALESLRTQGRKIGVISHIQEMTERIPVHIQVIRNGNGKSSLEIG